MNKLKKFFIVLALLLVIVPSAAVLSACGCTPTDETVTVTYTVTFVDWDGTTLSQQKIEEGSAVVAPTNPSRTGYEFIGWSVTDYSNITSDLIIVAKYNVLSATDYSVVFKDSEGNVLSTQIVEKGKSAVAPAAPFKPGFSFVGWDSDFDAVNSNLTVTAQQDDQYLGKYVGKYERDGIETITLFVNEDKTWSLEHKSTDDYDKTIFFFEGSWDWSTSIEGRKDLRVDDFSLEAYYLNTLIWKANEMWKIANPEILMNYSSLLPIWGSAFGDGNYLFAPWDGLLIKEGATPALSALGMYAMYGIPADIIIEAGSTLSEIISYEGSGAFMLLDPLANLSKNNVDLDDLLIDTDDWYFVDVKLGEAGEYTVATIKYRLAEDEDYTETQIVLYFADIDFDEVDGPADLVGYKLVEYIFNASFADKNSDWEEIIEEKLDEMKNIIAEIDEEFEELGEDNPIKINIWEENEDAFGRTVIEITLTLPDDSDYEYDIIKYTEIVYFYDPEKLVVLEEISDIINNGPSPIWVEKNGKVDFVEPYSIHVILSNGEEAYLKIGSGEYVTGLSLDQDGKVLNEAGFYLVQYSYEVYSDEDCTTLVETCDDFILTHQIVVIDGESEQQDAHIIEGISIEGTLIGIDNGSLNNPYALDEVDINGAKLEIWYDLNEEPVYVDITEDMIYSVDCRYDSVSGLTELEIYVSYTFTYLGNEYTFLIEYEENIQNAYKEYTVSGPYSDEECTQEIVGGTGFFKGEYSTVRLSAGYSVTIKLTDGTYRDVGGRSSSNGYTTYINMYDSAYVNNTGKYDIVSIHGDGTVVIRGGSEGSYIYYKLTLVA